MSNDAESIQYREFVVGLIGLAEQQRNRLRETIREIERHSQQFPARMQALSQEKASAENELSQIAQYLLKLGGGAS